MNGRLGSLQPSSSLCGLISMWDIGGPFLLHLPPPWEHLLTTLQSSNTPKSHSQGRRLPLLASHVSVSILVTGSVGQWGSGQCRALTGGLERREQLRKAGALEAG